MSDKGALVGQRLSTIRSKNRPLEAEICGGAKSSSGRVKFGASLNTFRCR